MNDTAHTQETTAMARVDDVTGELTPFDLPVERISDADFTVKGLNADETNVLTSAFDDDDWDILPTGEVYVNHMKYRERLTRVFGAMGWGMRDLDALRFDADTGVAYQTWELIARGVKIAKAVGSARYSEDASKRLDYADTAEAAKSNALTRCCKDLSIGSELYDRRKATAWKRVHAVKVWVEGKNKPQWRRVDSDPFYGEKGVAADSPKATVVQHPSAPAPVASQPATTQPAPAATTAAPQTARPAQSSTSAHEAREIGPTHLGSVKIKRSGLKQDSTPYTIYTVTTEDGRTFDTYDEKISDVANQGVNRGVAAVLTVTKKPDRAGRLWDVLTGVRLTG